MLAKSCGHSTMISNSLQGVHLTSDSICSALNVRKTRQLVPLACKNGQILWGEVPNTSSALVIAGLGRPSNYARTAFQNLGIWRRGRKYLIESMRVACCGLKVASQWSYDKVQRSSHCSASCVPLRALLEGGRLERLEWITLLAQGTT